MPRLSPAVPAASPMDSSSIVRLNLFGTSNSETIQDVEPPQDGVSAQSNVVAAVRCSCRRRAMIGRHYGVELYEAGSPTHGPFPTIADDDALVDIKETS